jgi:hypothetical protein
MDSAMVSAVIVFVVLLVMVSATIVHIVTPEAGARAHAEANDHGRDLDDLQANGAHGSLRRETFLLVPMTGPCASPMPIDRARRSPRADCNRCRSTRGLPERALTAAKERKSF